MQRLAQNWTSNDLALAATATGTPFDVAEAVADVATLLGQDIPTAGPTRTHGDPDTGGWIGSGGANFRLAVLWESRAYLFVPGDEWDSAQQEVKGYVEALATELGKNWGRHRTISMRAYLLREVPEESFPPLIAEICSFSLYGELLVWGPVPTAVGERWVVVSASQCDEDAPHIMFAAVSDVPVLDPDD